LDCAIPLFSGIGNVIQGLPFIFEMKKRYKNVVLFYRYVDFPDTVKLLKGIVNTTYGSIHEVPNGYKIFKTPIRRSFPESKAWFTDNKEKLPNKLAIPSINYSTMKETFDIVIWPECKTNWPCKKWIYWQQLIQKLLACNKKIAIVGVEQTEKFPGTTDYRNKLNLLQTGGIIKNSKMFIGNEGGIAHYSAALGVKTYIIFGCSDVTKNLPPNNATPIAKGLPCQPCQFNGLKQKGITMHGCSHRKCLSQLSVEDVIRSINI